MDREIRGSRIGRSEGRGQEGQRVEEPKKRAECYSEIQERRPCAEHHMMLRHSPCELDGQGRAVKKMDAAGGGLGHSFTTSVSWTPRKRNAGTRQDGPGWVQEVCVGGVKGVHWDRLGAKLQKGPVSWRR